MKKSFAISVLTALWLPFAAAAQAPMQSQVEQGIAALEGECAQGQHAVCNDSGLLLLNSAIVEAAWRTRGMAMLQKACDASFERSCNELERLQTMADSIAEHSAQCEQGDAAACTQVGSWTLSGMAGAPDRAAARQYLATGCKGGQHEACERGAMLDTLAEADGPAKLVNQLDAACKAGNSDKCFELGTALMTGALGVERDRTRGRALLEEVCQKRGTACGLLQHFDMQPKMLAELEASCGPGQSRPCTVLANNLWSGALGVQDRARAEEIFARTCEGGYALACVTRDLLRLGAAQSEMARP